MPLARVRGIPLGFEAGDLPIFKYVADRVPGWGINLDSRHDPNGLCSFFYHDLFPDL